MNDVDDQRDTHSDRGEPTSEDNIEDDDWPDEVDAASQSGVLAPDLYPSFAIGAVVTDDATVDLTIKQKMTGAMGLVLCGPSVYRSNQWIALKLLKPEYANDLAFREAYEREAVTWCHVWPHRYLVTANGLTRFPTIEGGQPGLILSYAGGGTLRDRIERALASDGTPIPLAKAFAWAQHLAAALVAIHTPDPAHERPHPLIHADVKPENIMIDLDSEGEEVAQLTDLGMARVWAASSSDTEITPTRNTSDAWLGATGAAAQTSASSQMRDLMETSRVEYDRTAMMSPFHSQRLPLDPAVPEIGSQGPAFGTKSYMPPEQWLGDDAIVPATDIYAFGIVLFELFAGIEQRPQILDLQGEETIMQALYISHTRGPQLHLTDPGIKALERGPLSVLIAPGPPEARSHAHAILTRLSALVDQCVAPNSQDRPTAVEVGRVLGELAAQAGLPPEDNGDRMPVTPPNEATFWNNLANTYGHLGQHDEHERIARLAVACAPDDPELLANLATALSKTDRGEEAFDCFQRAADCLSEPTLDDPIEQFQWRIRLAILRRNWAAAYLLRGRYDEAVTTYLRSLEMDPTSVTTRYGLAQTYIARANAAYVAGNLPLQLDNVRQAEGQLIRLLTSSPDFSQAQRSLSDVRAVRESIEDALEQHQEMLDDESQ